MQCQRILPRRYISDKGVEVQENGINTEPVVRKGWQGTNKEARDLYKELLDAVEADVLTHN